MPVLDPRCSPLTLAWAGNVVVVLAQHRQLAAGSSRDCEARYSAAEDGGRRAESMQTLRRATGQRGDAMRCDAIWGSGRRAAGARGIIVTGRSRSTRRPRGGVSSGCTRGSFAHPRHPPVRKKPPTPTPTRHHRHGKAPTPWSELTLAACPGA